MKMRYAASLLILVFLAGCHKDPEVAASTKTPPANATANNDGKKPSQGAAPMPGPGNALGDQHVGAKLGGS